jgi:uncharacterized protein (DUF983 family)
MLKKLFKTAITQKCPACKKGGLFYGVMMIHKECTVCNMHIPQSDLADGPIFISMCIILFIFTPLFVVMELKYSLPIYMHLIISLPILIIAAIYFARAGRAFMIAHKYHLHDAK